MLIEKQKNIVKNRIPPKIDFKKLQPTLPPSILFKKPPNAEHRVPTQVYK